MIKIWRDHGNACARTDGNNYSNADSAVWRFTSSGSGFANPVKNWDSGEGGWNWDRSGLAGPSPYGGSPPPSPRPTLIARSSTPSRSWRPSGT